MSYFTLVNSRHDDDTISTQGFVQATRYHQVSSSFKSSVYGEVSCEQSTVERFKPGSVSLPLHLSPTFCV